MFVTTAATRGAATAGTARNAATVFMQTYLKIWQND